jgi:hypothetical protein
VSAENDRSNAQVVEVTNIHENTSQEVIRITVDRLKLVLVEHKNGFERRKEWHTPLGLVVTVILVFNTSSFKDAFGLTGATWSAFFLFVLVVSLGWLGRAIYIAWTCPSLGEIVERMKR